MTISTAQKEALSLPTQRNYFVSFTTYSVDWIQSARNRDHDGLLWMWR